MQYREPINVRDIVSEVRRLWVLPLVVGVAFAVLFAALKVGASSSFEQRVDVVGTEDSTFAGALQLPAVVERFDADVVAQREASKLEVLNRESKNSERVRVQGSAQTNTLSVFGSAPSGEAALDLAKRYADDLVVAQRAAATKRLEATKQLFDRQLDRIQASLETSANGGGSERVLLLIDQASKIQLLEGLNTFTQIAGGGVRDPETIGPAAEIRRSSLFTYALLGALLGLVIGAAFIVVRRALSSAVFGEADLARYGSCVPVLADLSGSEDSNRGVFAALASACGHGESPPGRVPGVLFSGVSAGNVPSSLASGVLAALPALGMQGSAISPDAFATIDSTTENGQFHVVVVDDAIRESSSAIACAGRLASTVVVVRRRKTSIASALEAMDLVVQADGQLRGVVIVD